MRFVFLFSLLATISATAAQAQTEDTAPDGVWGTLQGIDSADLAVRGWTLIGTAAVPAGEQTGLLVTFWRAQTGVTARCVFSLVNATGTEAFETCAAAATRTQEAGDQ